MADISPTSAAPRWTARLDGAWVTSAAILVLVAVLRPADIGGIATTASAALLGTLPFIAFAVFAVAYLRATSAEGLIAKAFTGSEPRMILAAALVGGLAPFCSCEVIPFIAALLAFGAPLSAVMALWLASPLMDPAMFVVTASGLGIDFAIAKTVAAVSLGLLGGFGVMALRPTGLYTDALKAAPATGCCGPKRPATADPVWRFWREADRRATFADTARTNGMFLLKWLTLAYVLEALMIRYVPAEWIAGVLGGEGPWPIMIGALVGGPAYLNGFAAVPLLDGLIEQGMNPGAAMSFAIAGGVSSIPAAVAVWALVKPRVFASYLSFGLVGSLIAGFAWAAIA